MKTETIKINGDDVVIGLAIEKWEEAGVCRYCINRRLYLNRTYEDSYDDFAFAHDENCLC